MAVVVSKQIFTRPHPAELLRSYYDDLITNGPPIEAVESGAYQPQTASWKEYIYAKTHQTVGTLGDPVARWIYGGEPDPNFDPGKYIRSNPGLDQDPIVWWLYNRGQFDDAVNETDFQILLDQGRQYVDDISVMARGSSMQKIAGMGLDLLDPVFLVSLAATAGVASLARATSTAAKAVRAAVVGAASYELSHKIRAGMTPASDEPGAADDLAGMAATAALFAGTYVLGWGIGRIRDAIPNARRMQQIRAALEEFKNTKLVRDVKELPNVDPLKDMDLSINEILNVSKKQITDLLENPVDNARISPLFDPAFGGDENYRLLKQLKEKYRQEGKKLHVVPRPDPEVKFYRMVRYFEKIGSVEIPDYIKEATAEDFPYYNVIDKLFVNTATLINKPAGMAMVSRVKNLPLRRLREALATVADSLRPITVDSARNPFEATHGPTVEGIFDHQRLIAGDVQARLKKVAKGYKRWLRRADRVQEFAGVRLQSWKDLLEAAGNWLRLKEAELKGYDVTAPTPIPEPITAILDELRAYMNKQLLNMESAGLMKIGPRALKEIKGKIKYQQRKLRELKKLYERRGQSPPAEAVEEIEKELAHLARRKAAVEKELTRMTYYSTQIYDVNKVLPNRTDFTDDLVMAMREGHVVEGKPIIEDAVRKVDSATIADELARITGGPVDDMTHDEMVKFIVDNLTEAELSPKFLATYEKAKETVWTQIAEQTYDLITGIPQGAGKRSGIYMPAMIPDPLQLRLMQANPARMAKWMINDPMKIVNYYMRATAPRYAVSRAIQLNPQIWEKARLTNGTKVRTLEDLFTYVDEGTEAFYRFAQFHDEHMAKRGVKFKPLLPVAKKMQYMVERDFKRVVEDMLGIRTMAASKYAGYQYMAAFGRSILYMNYANKLGCVALTQINDFAPMSLFALMRPQTLRLLIKAIRSLDKVTKRDLELIGLLKDHLIRTRRLIDVPVDEPIDGRLMMGFERGIRTLADWGSRINLMNFVTDIAKRGSAIYGIDMLTNISRKMVRAVELVEKEGMTLEAALRRVGLRGGKKSYWLAKVNKMGLNYKRAKLYHNLIYKYGLTMDDRPIREVMTFEEYMASSKPVKPNFEAWPLVRKDVKDLFDTIAINITSFVNHEMVVTPGAFDRPAFMITMPVLGRLLNQFQTFSMAFVNQRLNVMAQMPAHYQLWYAASYTFLGAMTDAIQAALSGRRSFTETAKAWEEQPLQMLYVAWERAGLLGWYPRIIRTLGTVAPPFARLMQGTSSFVHYASPDLPISMIGPFGSDLNRTYKVIRDVLNGKMSKWTALNFAKLLPGQNLLWLRLLHTTAGLPTVPEAITEAPVYSTPVLLNNWGSRRKGW